MRFIVRPVKRSFYRKFGKGSQAFGRGHRVEREVPVKRFLCIFGMFVVGMLLCVAVYFLAGIPIVKGIAVEGCVRYSPAFVAEATGISEGDKLLGFDAFAVEDKLREQMPLLREVNVRRHLNGQVTVEVTEEEKLYYTCHRINYYLISAEDLRVLDVSAYDSDYRRLGAVYVGFPEEARLQVGEKVYFEYLPYEPTSAPVEVATYEIETDVAEKEFSYTADCLKSVSFWSLADRVTGMDFSNRYDLYLILDGRIKVYLGAAGDLDRKLTQATNILALNTDETDLPALLDVSNPEKSTYREQSDLILPDWAGK